MDADNFKSHGLALAGMFLTLMAQPSCAQGLQPAPSIVTQDLPRPGATTTQAKPSPAPERSSGGAEKATPAQSQNPQAVGAAVRPNDVAGRYIILREGGRDMGCMLTLDDKARASNGDLKAQLAPACRDQGIVIFDPVAWRVERGRLVLTARKGHAATFDRQADGAWWKDPAEGGKPLGVKKI